MVAAAIYFAFAAGLGNAADLLTVTRTSATAEFALSHLVPLPIVIVLALVFLRRSGWWPEVWREPSLLRQTPHRWWMISIPAALALQEVLRLLATPWSERAATFIAIVALGTLCVGLGEELICRGILLVSLRGHHSEFFAFVISSLVFGLLHAPVQLIAGVPLGGVVFAVAALAMNGALYYAVRRVTGRLWVCVAIHALSDFGLYVQSGNADIDVPVATADIWLQVILIGLAAALLVSIARESLRDRRAHAVHVTP